MTNLIIYAKEVLLIFGFDKKKCSQDEELDDSPKITINTYIILKYGEFFSKFLEWCR